MAGFVLPLATLERFTVNNLSQNRLGSSDQRRSSEDSPYQRFAGAVRRVINSFASSPDF